jgi:membrane associated rhomboid family serine protease
MSAIAAVLALSAVSSFHGGPTLRPSLARPTAALTLPRIIPDAKMMASTAVPGFRASFSSSPQGQPTAVYALILGSIATFVADNIFHVPCFRALYLYHSHVRWWQPLSACFCHASQSHLSGNVFLLLLFGRSVEDELGWGGLLFSYAFCGIAANLVSLLLLPSATVSLGASGAVFGLFAVSILSRLSWRDLDWRKLVEVSVLGQFVIGRVLEEARTAATGGLAGVNHVAHLSGAGAGVVLVLLLRGTIAKIEQHNPPPPQGQRRVGF